MSLKDPDADRPGDGRPSRQKGARTLTTRTEFAMLCRKAGLPHAELADMLGYCERTLLRWEKGETKPRKAAVISLREYVNHRLKKNGSRTRESGEAFRFIDLFAGIGGLRRGFDAMGGRCVFTSEWNLFAQKTYLANYPCDDDHVMAGDITGVEAQDIPAHDLLLAGFPCQPFSIAGVSKKNALGRAHGFRCEAQGTLFFDVARIIEHHRPRVFLLENVKNLVNHDQGNTFRVIRETLENELGYHITTRVINAKGFVPQHRERIFIAGFREKTDFSLEDIPLPDTLSGPKLARILHPEDGSEEGPDHPFTDHKGQVSDKYTLSDKLWRYLQDYARKHRQRGNGFGFGLCGPDDVARTLSARYYKDGSEILIRRRRGNPRRLTPRECARLMGFDAPGGRAFLIPVSDTQAYKQFGNAVVVPVVEDIARHLAPCLRNHDAAQTFARHERAGL